MRNRLPAKSHIPKTLNITITPSTTKHIDQNSKILAISKFIKSPAALNHSYIQGQDPTHIPIPLSNLYQLISTTPNATKSHVPLASRTITINHTSLANNCRSYENYYKRTTPIHHCQNSTKQILSESSYEKAHRLDNRNTLFEIPISEGKENKNDTKNKDLIKTRTVDCNVSEWSTLTTQLSRNIGNSNCFKPVLITKYTTQLYNTQSKCICKTITNYSKVDIDTYRTSNSYKVKEAIRKKCCSHINKVTQ